MPPEQAKFIDKQVKSGGYASGSEVVRAGLRALQERDAAIERDPSQGIPIEKGFAEIRERHAARVKAGKK